MRVVNNVLMFIQREQEWNISRKELLELVDVGILVEDDIEEATAVKFNPVSFELHKLMKLNSAINVDNSVFFFDSFT